MHRLIATRILHNCSGEYTETPIFRRSLFRMDASMPRAVAPRAQESLASMHEEPIDALATETNEGDRKALANRPMFWSEPSPRERGSFVTIRNRAVSKQRPRTSSAYRTRGGIDHSYPGATYGARISHSRLSKAAPSCWQCHRASRTELCPMPASDAGRPSDKSVPQCVDHTIDVVIGHVRIEGQGQAARVVGIGAGKIELPYLSR